MNISVHIFVDNEGKKILEGIKSLSSLSDQDAHVLPFHINCEDTCILLIIFSDHNIHLHCFEDICQKIVRDLLDLCDLFISELRDHHFLFGGSFLTLISFLDRRFCFYGCRGSNRSRCLFNSCFLRSRRFLLILFGILLSFFFFILLCLFLSFIRAVSFFLLGPDGFSRFLFLGFSRFFRLL